MSGKGHQTSVTGRKIFETSGESVVITETADKAVSRRKRYEKKTVDDHHGSHYGISYVLADFSCQCGFAE